MVAGGWQHMGVARRWLEVAEKQQQWQPWGGGGGEEKKKVLCVVYLVANGPKYLAEIYSSKVTMVKLKPWLISCVSDKICWA